MHSFLPVKAQEPDSAEMDEAPEVVLFAAIGLTPAVLTETIWALAEEGPRSVPDRIVVCTTARGKERIEQVFFRDHRWQEFVRELERAFGEDFSDKLRFGPTGDSLRVIPTYRQDRELEDILTTEDNQAVGDFFLEHLRPFAESENIRIIASIAGGRKSMGALLLTVMSLIGREEDRVCHVLVEEPWDRVQGVLFPEKGRGYAHPDDGVLLDAGDMKIHLADIPFVPLRQIFPHEVSRFSGSYRGLLSRLRCRSSRLSEQLQVVLDPARGSCHTAGKSLDLSPREYLFLLSFAVRASEGRGPLATFAQFPEDDARSLAESYRKKDDPGHWSHDALQWLQSLDANEDLRKIAMSIRRKAAQSGVEPVAISRIVPGKGYIGIELSPTQISIKT